MSDVVSSLGKYGQQAFTVYGGAAQRASASSLMAHSGVSVVGSSATQAHVDAVKPIVPTAKASPLTQASRPPDSSIPVPVLIGAGVLGVGVIGLVIFKLSKR